MVLFVYRNTQAQSPAQENGAHVPVETVIFYNAQSPVGTGKHPLPIPVPRADDDVMNDGYNVIDDGYDVVRTEL